MWSKLMWFMWSDFILKWSEVSYGEVFGDKNAMYIGVTSYWGYLIVLWLISVECILYCGCFNLFCNVWGCVCVGFVMCGVLVICVLVFIVFVLFVLYFLYYFVYVYLFSFALSVSHCATSRKVAGSIPDGVNGIFIDTILPAALWPRGWLSL